MTREGTRPLAALVVAMLVAASFVACGGSGSDSSSTQTTASSTSERDTAQSGGEERQAQKTGQTHEASQERQGDQPQSGQQHNQSRSQQGNGGGSGDVATPLKVSGGGSDQFRTKGGDNSIQEYGEEGDESELREAAETVHSFYVAQAEEDWAAACSYLAKSTVERLLQLASQSPKFKDAGCAAILNAFTRSLPASVGREITTVDAGSFRHDSEQGFLIYYGAEHTVYSMPMRNEGSGWLVTAISASAIG